jgi:hypothetical protein
MAAALPSDQAITTASRWRAPEALPAVRRWRREASSRTVMVRDWYEAPAIPEADVKAAFGGQFVLDPRVELVELTVEYWTQNGVPQDLAAARILEALQGRRRYPLAGVGLVAAG